MLSSQKLKKKTWDNGKVELNCKRLRFFSWSPLRMFLLANSSTKMNSSKDFISNFNLPHNIWRLRIKTKSKRFLVGATLRLCLKITTRRLATPTSKLFNFVRKWKIAQSTSATHKSLTLLQFRRWRWATNFSVQRSAKDNSRTMSMVQGRLAMNFFVQGSTKDEPWTMNTVQGRWDMNFFVQGSKKDEPWTLNRVQGRWQMNFFVQGSTKDEPWTLNMVQGRWVINFSVQGSVKDERLVANKILCSWFKSENDFQVTS